VLEVAEGVFMAQGVGEQVWRGMREAKESREEGVFLVV